MLVSYLASLSCREKPPLFTAAGHNIAVSNIKRAKKRGTGVHFTPCHCLNRTRARVTFTTCILERRLLCSKFKIIHVLQKAHSRR